MTEAQVKHAKLLTDKFSYLMTKKYEAGVTEHGGNIWEIDILPLLYMLRDEVLDSFVYLQTAIDEFENL